MCIRDRSVPGIVGIAILVILVLVIIVRNIYVVQQSRAYVVERLGAFHSCLLYTSWMSPTMRGWRCC